MRGSSSNLWPNCIAKDGDPCPSRMLKGGSSSL